MKVRSVVKVMNFHALLRVDSSRRQAEKYNAMEKQLSTMMRLVMNNRNLNLDQILKTPDKSKPVLRIYIGSDYGFCGSVNSSLSMMKAVDKGDSIVIGKRLRGSSDALLTMREEDLRKDASTVKKYMEEAVREGRWSAIELCYNHYYNMSSIVPVRKQIYPPAEPRGLSRGSASTTDYMIEGNPVEILQKMIIACLNCEVIIAMHSAYASENVMRQNATNESLKKLDEIEAEELRDERRRKNEASFRKTVDSYIRRRSFEE